MPPSCSSPAMAAGDHQHQAATTQCLGMPASQKPTLTTAGHRLQSLGLPFSHFCQRNAMLAYAHCSYGQASNVSSMVRAQHCPGLSKPQCRVLSGPLLFQRGAENTSIHGIHGETRALTIQVPHFLFQTPLAAHF